MTSLYKMTMQYCDAWQQMENMDELDELSISDTLESLEIPIKEKIINTAYYIKDIESDIEELNRAISDLNERKNKLNNRAENLKNYIKNSMYHVHINEVKSPLFDVKLRNNPGKINIIDESIIPDEFFNVKELISIDKNKIKERIKLGEEIPGAELIITKSLVIK